MRILSPMTRAILKREWRASFGHPTAYVFIVFFVLFCAVGLFRDVFFKSNEASLQPLNELFPWLLVVYIPAVTMGLWSSERRQGTEELLLTLPARDREVVLGKTLAGIAIYTCTLAFTLPLLVILGALGNPDWSLVAANYFGFWLFGSALIGAGLAGSQLSDNMTVAFVLGVVLCLPIVLSDQISAFFLGGHQLSSGLHLPVALFQEMGQGLVSLAGVLVFVGLAVAFGYLNLLLLSRRHWRGGEGLHKTLRFAALVVTVVGLSIAAGNSGFRADATTNSLHSLSPHTVSLIQNLEGDQPVLIEAFVSPEVPREYVRQRRDLLNLLRQYDRLGGDQIRVRIVDTEPYSAEARLAEQKYEIEQREVVSEEELGNRRYEMFLGVAFTCGPRTSLIPFLFNKLPVEYELTKRIMTVAQTEKRKVGVLTTEVKLFGDFDFQTRSRSPRWEIISELETQYDLVQVSATEDYPDDIDALLVPMVSSLNQEEMDRLSAWMKAGGRAVLTDDPICTAAPGTEASTPTRGGGPPDPMTGRPSQGEPKGNVKAFLREFGFRYDPAKVVWDGYNPHPDLFDQIPPEIVFIGANSGGEAPFSAKDPITSGLQELVMLYAGCMTSADESPLSFEPLLHTSPLSGTLPESDIFARDFFGEMRMNPRRVHRRDPGQVLAARTQGRLEGATADCDVVFIADLDLFSSQFFNLRRNAYRGAPDLNFDNVTFILNAIDAVVGDDSFIALRKRRPQHRTLEHIEARDREFRTTLQDERNEAEKLAEVATEEAEKRFQAKVAAIEQDDTLDNMAKSIRIATVRSTEQRRKDVAEARIAKERDARIRAARAEALDAQRSLRRQWSLLGWGISPLLAALVGLMVFFGRAAREAEGVPSARAKGGK